MGIISKSETVLSNADEDEVKEFLRVEKDDFKNDDGDSMYGSMNTDNDNWVGRESVNFQSLFNCVVTFLSSCIPFQLDDL